MLINPRDFVIKIPDYHPLSADYTRFWTEQLRKSIEGAWLGGYYMPPSLYFYINFGHIQLNRSRRSNDKVIARPDLRDVEWMFFRYFTEALGFSGFEDDPHLSCDKILLEEPLEIIQVEYPHLLQPNGTPKAYVPAREYLTSQHPLPYTLPLYENEVKNILMLGSRDSGKSYITSGLISHLFTTDGFTRFNIDDFGRAQSYTGSLSETVQRAEITVGAEDSQKSALLLDKVKILLDLLPGSKYVNGKYYPSPLSKKYKGSWTTGKQIIAEREKKLQGGWVTVGSRSTIRHRSFSNPFADQGSRPKVTVLEEVGHFSNLKEVYKATKDNLRNGLRKTGCLMMLGCVNAGTKVWTSEGKLINIEDLQQDQGILGYNGSTPQPQPIPHLKPPQTKPSYRITTNSGNFIECSHDHPLLWSNNKGTTRKGKNITFRTAEEVKLKDQLLMIDEVPVFGTQYIKDARLMGLLIGDGYSPKRGSPTIGTDDLSIQSFLESYPHSVKKTFTTKKGNTYNEYTIYDTILRNHGLQNLTKEAKRLPPDVHTFDKESLALLLGGYFDADGNVTTKKPRIVLTSAVSELLTQVKYQLSKFGIHSSIVKEFRKTGYKSNSYVFRLYINRNESIIRFRENIPLLSKHKVHNLSLITPTTQRYKASRYLYHQNISNLKGKFFFGKNNLTNLRYETVTSIEYLGEKPVYNLTADITHTYLANNFITHNTGGDMEQGTIDAYEMFYNPEGFDILPFEDTWENKGMIGFFLPAYLALNPFKNDQGFTDVKAATEALLARRNKERTAKGNSSTLHSEMQYRPIVPSEMFLTKSQNIFPTPEIRRRLGELESSQELLATPYTLFFDPNSSYNGISAAPNLDSPPIDRYPFPEDSNLESSVVIYEHPRLIESKVPSDAYIIGCDPFKDDAQSSTGSMAAIYVIKTPKHPTSIGHDEIVASYIGRPYAGKSAVNEILYKLSLYYGNAKIYFENAVGNVKDYFERIKRLDLLALQPTTVFNKKASYLTDQPLIYGYPMSNQKVKWEALQYVRDWLLLPRSTTEDKVTRNLDLIPDKILLQQLASFTLEGNFDAVMGFVGCIIGLEEIRTRQKISLINQDQNSKSLSDLSRLIANNPKIFNGKLSSPTAFLQKEVRGQL